MVFCASTTTARNVELNSFFSLKCNILNTFYHRIIINYNTQYIPVVLAMWCIFACVCCL